MTQLDHPPWEGTRRKVSTKSCPSPAAGGGDGGGGGGGGGQVTPHYKAARDAIIADINTQHNTAVQAYQRALVEDDQGAIDAALAKLKNIRQAVRENNDTVAASISNTSTVAHGICTGDDATCSSKTTAGACAAAGCNWTMSDAQTMYRRSQDLSQQSTELADRRERLKSSMQRAEQMQQKYRYVNKVFWIYALLALALVGAFIYLYSSAYKQFTASGGSLGAAFTGALSSGVEKVNDLKDTLKDKLQGDEGDEGDEGEEGEEGEEVEEGLEEEE